MRRPALTFWIGAAVIVAAEALLAIDVGQRDAIATGGVLAATARWVAFNMTPVAWVGFLLVMDGVLAAGSPARTRPRRFAVCFVTSVCVWLFFDWVNFYFINAWDYHGLDSISVVHDRVARFVAFGAISPALFMVAELYQRLGLARLRGPRLAIGPRVRVAMLIIGVPALLFPFVVQRPIGSLTLWVGVVLVLDPLNFRFGDPAQPTLIRDWHNGRWGRTVSLLAAGLTCGVLWEFWNYWALARWTYDLPFLGTLENYRLFEMPLPGFAGFPPFALECWVAFQTVLLVMRKVGMPFVERPPGDDAVL